MEKEGRKEGKGEGGGELELEADLSFLPLLLLRARLIGLAAISSAATSDALYASGQYKEQISIIVPALLACFYQTDVPSLEEQ